MGQLSLIEIIFRKTLLNYLCPQRRTQTGFLEEELLEPVLSSYFVLHKWEGGEGDVSGFACEQEQGDMSQGPIYRGF